LPEDSPKWPRVETMERDGVVVVDVASMLFTIKIDGSNDKDIKTEKENATITLTNLFFIIILLN
jgi:hypothetical protein